MSNPLFESTSTVDIGPALRGEHRATDQAIARALADHGSFVAVGFDGATGIGALMAELASFFDLADGDKLACATCNDVSANKNVYRGFYPLPEQRKWSHNETFDIGPEPAMSSPDVPGAESFREANVWPAEELLPGWRSRMLAMLEFQRELSVSLMEATARGLGHDAQRLLSPSYGRNATLRLLHYAPAPAEFAFKSYDDDEAEVIADGRRLMARSHVDTGLLALLWQDSGGLQMQGPDGEWRDVPVTSSGFSVHCGNLLEPLTDGVLTGTLHRVVGHNQHRRSVGFWLEPDFDTEIMEPEGVRPVSYAQHLVNQFPDRFEASRAAATG
tara:strand:- start:784 stop:1770 length:987 start_codon:yes stop_codon:yes gene_type:complete